MEILIIFWSFVLGTCFGSFFGVLIDRMQKNESIVTPRSHCDNCDHQLKWYENIPVLSYIFLGGRCKNCKKRIPLRFLLVEILFGIGTSLFVATMLLK